jgi:hypothetical protein
MMKILIIYLSLLFLSFTVLCFNCGRVWKQEKEREGRFGKDSTRNSENEAEFFSSFSFSNMETGERKNITNEVFLTPKANKT